MIYKGKEIEDHKDVLTNEISYKEYGHNYVEFTFEDLEDLVRDYREKEKSLKENGVEFRDLTLNFYGTSYHYNPNVPDGYSNMGVFFSYYRPETEEEHDEDLKNGDEGSGTELNGRASQLY